MSQESKKQTAVEWLVEQIIKYGLVPQGTNPDNILFQQAKEMEKLQIINAVDGFPIENRHLDAEQYYNEVYGKE